MAEDGHNLSLLMSKVWKAADGDSNDTEIMALQGALDEALRLLGREDLRG